MSNIYDILKFFLRIKSRRLKLFGLWLLHCYVSANSCWQDDFDYHSESFETYASSHH